MNLESYCAPSALPKMKKGAVHSRPSRRRAVTLIELLIALAITMIMMGAVVTMFGLVSDGVAGSRAIIEVTQRISSARNRLQTDLAGHTATMLPPLRPETGEGYFEYIEGPFFDAQFVSSNLSAPSPANLLANSAQGDWDDVLMLTVRSAGEPFVGRIMIGGNAVTLESPVAEVIWFAVPNGKSIPTATGTPLTPGTNLQLCTLYRRVLLVDPQVQSVLGSIAPSMAFYGNYDISARGDALTGIVMANSLGDLTKRENRFYHTATGFPFSLSTTNLQSNTPGVAPIFASLNTARLGEDVILSDVLAFDIKAYDPLAVLRTAADGTLFVPSDPGYNAVSTVAGSGAYVDLNYSRYVSSLSGSGFSYFSGPPVTASGLASYSAVQPQPPTYDTWSLHYEQNGIDEDGSGTADQGVDGLDSPVNAATALPPGNSANADGTDRIVDNAPTIIPSLGQYYPGERETLPPYPVPLRGIQIKIRVYEPDSRQVREVTVVQDFVPE